MVLQQAWHALREGARCIAEVHLCLLLDPAFRGMGNVGPVNLRLAGRALVR